MAQTPVSSTPTTTTNASTGSDEAQALNGVEPGNTAPAQVAAAATLAGTDATAIASAAAPAAVRGVDMNLVQDSAGPNINPAMLNASAQIQTRQAQAQANPSLLNASAKTGAIGYTAMKFGRTENLNKPAAGKTVTLHADAGEQFKVNFDPNAADLSVRNGDLVFNFNDGSRIVIDHFVMAGNQMPSLLLPDGTLLAGGVVVAQLSGKSADDLFNIETAAGPGAGGAGGSGGFIYSDNLGDVIGLLDKLPPIPFTALAFPQPTDFPVPFAFTQNGEPGSQTNYFNSLDETNGLPSGVQTGQILPNFGPDGGGTVTLSPNVTFGGQYAGTQLTSNGVPVITTLNGNVITGTANGVPVFTLTLNPGNSYEFQLLGQLDHGDPANPNEPITISFTYVVTDVDGDTGTGGINITVLDDAPVAINDVNHVDNNDTIMGNVITGAGQDVVNGVNGADTLSKDATNKLTAVGLINAQTLTPFNGTGEALTIQGKYGTLTIKPDGSYTYTHTTGTGQLVDEFKYKLTDRDGDSSEAKLTINITDTVPEIDNQGQFTGANALDESFQIGQAIQGNIVYTASQGSPSTTVSFGIDNAANFSAIGSVAGTTLHSNGQVVNVALINGVYVGYTGTDPNAAGSHVFELTLNNGTTGAYTFKQLQNLDHADGNDPNDVITLQFGVTVTDADGDKDTGILNIAIRDDAPVANDDVMQAIREVRVYDFSANAPNFPSLQEQQQLPTSQPILYQQGVDKASNVVVDMATTVHVERTVSSAVTAGAKSALFAFTQDGNGNITNIKLLFGNATSDANTGSGGPMASDYVMEASGKLGFFILRDGFQSLVAAGVSSADGTPNPGYSYELQPNGQGGYKVHYTGPNGVSGDLMYIENGQATVAMDPSFAGNFLGQPVYGVAGRNDGDGGNVLHYGFEDTPFSNPLNDKDFNDVQITVTVAPVSVINLPPVTGNVLANDVVGQDDLARQPNVTENGTKVTQVSFENNPAVSFANPTGADGSGKFIQLVGEYGTLKIYENGAYTYAQNGKVTGDLRDVFHYTMTDRDGDTASANLVIRIGSNYAPSLTTSAASLLESHLTNANPADDTVTKGISIISKDGVGAVALSADGMPILSSNGQPVTYAVSPDGKTLTATAGGQTVFTVVLNGVTGGTDGNYQSTYTFTLKQPLTNPGNGANVTDIPVKIIVTDGNGDSATGTLGLQVVDDVPTAVNDSFGLGNNSSLTGNILNNDNFGADGRGTPAVTSVTFQGQTQQVSAQQPATFNGANGEKLVVNADGSIQYTKPTNATAVDANFTYTIQDRDGDTSQANVHIGGNDNPVVIITPPQAGAPGVVLNEHDLLTAPNPDSISSTITFTAPDGFGGITLTTTGLPVLSSNGQPVTYTITPDGHTLTGTAGGTTVFTVTVPGTVTQQPDGTYTTPYTFTLNQPLDNPGAGPNITNIPVNFVVTDTDGDTATSTLPLQVVDDVPVATADTLSLGNNLSGTGTNLLANDSFGADGPATNPGTINSVTYGGTTKDFTAPTGTENGVKFVTFDTPQGQLKVFENGNYSFTRPATFGELNQQFSYTIKDHDGDISSANVTIIGNDNPVTILSPAVNPAGAQIPESDLLVPGTDAVTNQVSFTAPDGVASITLATNGLPDLTAHGQPVTYSLSQDGKTLNGMVGNQTIFTVVMGNPTQQPDGSYRAGYTFTLLQPLDNPGAGQNITDIPVRFVVTDTDGDQASSSLPLKVIDHVPTAVNDSLVLGNAASGVGTNLLANDSFGADGPAANPASVNSVTFGGTTKDFTNPTGTENGIKFVTFDTPQGLLKVFENGTYGFTRNAAGGELNQQFSYTIKDHDGDISAANVTITGNDNPVIITSPTINAPGVIVDEHNLLPLGQATTTANSTITFTAPDGFSALSLSTNGLPQLTSYGVPVTYQLTNNGHTLVGMAGSATVFLVTVDNPVQQADGSYRADYRFTLVQALTDQGDGKNVTSIPVQVTVSDTDGDTAAATLPLRVIDDVPLAIDDSLNMGLAQTAKGTNLLLNDHFNADNAPNGVPAVNSVSYLGQTKSFDNPTGIENGVKFVSFVNLGGGTLKVFENGEYSFTRNDANAPISRYFEYTIKDSDGDISSAQVNIFGQRQDNPVTILSPALDPNGAIIPESSLLVAGVDTANNRVSFTAPDGVDSIRMTTDGLPPLVAQGQPVAYTLSADGHTLTGAVGGQTVFTVVMGNPVQQADGSYQASYVFTLLKPLDNPGDGQNITNIPVRFVVTDTDGDDAAATLPLQVVDHVPTVANSVHEVDETSGQDQSVFNVVSGSVQPNYGADGPADTNAFTLTGMTVSGVTQLMSTGVPVSIALQGDTYIGQANGKTVFSLHMDSTGSYTFRQYMPLDHQDPNNPDESLGLQVHYAVRDHDGDVVNGALTINVHDDAPITAPDENSVTVQTQVFNILRNPPDFPTLLEYRDLPTSQPDLFNRGVDQASNVSIGYPTTISIDKIVDPNVVAGAKSALFVFTEGQNGITNVQLVFTNATSDPVTGGGGGHFDYNMTSTGNLGFFILRDGADYVSSLGAGSYTLQGGTLYFNGQPVPYEPSFSGTYGIAGRDPGDPENVLHYGFEDTPMGYSGNDLDFNDVQFKVTVNPTYVQVSPPISGNVLPNDRVGLDVMPGHAYNTMVTQIALGMSGFISLANATQSDANGKYVEIQGEYGLLRMHENGEYTYTFNRTTTGGDMTDDFRYTIRDFDGDTSNASTLTIHVVDSGIVNKAMVSFSGTADNAAPAVIDDSHHMMAKVLIVPEETPLVDPAHAAVMVSAPAAGDEHAAAPADHAADAQVAGQVVNGAAHHFALDGEHVAGLTSNGHAIETTMVDGTLHGAVNGQDVFTLSLDTNGHYQFDLHGTIDQASSGPLSFGYTAVDNGTVEGQLMVDVHSASSALPSSALALSDLVSGGDSAAGHHADVAVNMVSNADIINSILDNQDPHNGYNGQG